jgi:hypothetical protein
MPKAFDADSSEPRNPLDRFWSIGLGEFVACLTLLYVCSISAFNAGYFTKIPGRFSDLFTFADLVGTNLTIIQYLVPVYGAICFLFGVISVALEELFPLWRQRIESHFQDRPALFILIFGGVLLAALLSAGCVGFLQDQFGVSNLTLALLPALTFQGIAFFVAWLAYRYEAMTFRSLASSLFVNLFMLSFNVGQAWMKHDVLSNGEIQAIMLQDGACIHRKILRVSSNGYLLLNTSLKAFEFRNKDTVRTVFDTANCL